MRILYLTQRLPYAPNRGDRLRAWHAVRYLAREHDVTVGALVHDAEEAGHAGDLSRMTREVIIGRVPYLANRVRGAVRLLGERPLTLSLLDAPELSQRLRQRYATDLPDLVVASCSSMARFAMEPPLADVPLIIDMIDADSAKWRDYAGIARFPMTWIYRREARTLRAFEAVAMRHARVTLVVNEREQRELLAVAADVDVRVVPVGIDVAKLARPADVPPPGAQVVFCGVMDYEPNVDAAVWLAHEVWPRVRRLVPAATLCLVGASPTPVVRGLANAGQGITVTGTVDDVRPYLWQAAVSVAPLHTARGVQTKVLEALGAGLPCVVTPAVAEGLPNLALRGCLVHDDAPGFAAAVTNLLDAPWHERQSMVTAAHADGLDWESRFELIGQAVRDATTARA